MKNNKILLLMLILLTTLLSGCAEQESRIDEYVELWENEKLVIRNTDELNDLVSRKGEAFPVVISGTPVKGEEFISDRFKGEYEYAFVREITEAKRSSGGFIAKVPGTNFTTINRTSGWREAFASNLTEPVFYLNGIKFSVDILKKQNVIFDSSKNGLRKMTNEEVSTYLKDDVQRSVDDGYYYSSGTDRFSYYVLDSKPLKILAYMKDGNILIDDSHSLFIIYEDGSSSEYSIYR